MQLLRLYYNASSELLRTDTINVQPSLAVAKEIVTYSFGDMKVSTKETRSTQLFYGPTSRVVSSIEVTGDFGAIEGSTDYLWATWTLGNDQVVLCDMSNLPAVGDTV